MYNWRLLWAWYWNFGFHKMWVICFLFRASQEGSSFVVVLNVTDWHLCNCSIEVVKPRILLPVGEMTFRHLDVAVLGVLRFVLHSLILTMGIKCVLFSVLRRNTDGLETALQATVNQCCVFCCCYTQAIITMIICETVWGWIRFASDHGFVYPSPILCLD